jgi:glycosyltransferase involved in cell wall biosynthesis
MTSVPRVALLTDSLAEVNGAARTCRELAAFARNRNLPFLTASYGAGCKSHNGSRGEEIVLPLSRVSIRVDTDLHFDPLFCRHAAFVRERLRNFRPDVIHIIGPGGAGLLGAMMARRLRRPLVISWHTNFHEFAAKRLSETLPRPARRWSPAIERAVERTVLGGTLWFYGRGDVLLAPNTELVEMLRRSTGKPTFLMSRGIDTETFHPRHRNRRAPKAVRIGFVGRLMPEKNVRFLATLGSRLARETDVDFELMIVGDGRERPWLQSNVNRGLFPGFLKGPDLSEAYANLDIFVFPSRTDAFGNVVQEAAASGVPAVVMCQGGPKFLVENGVTGFVARDEEEFIHRVRKLVDDPELRTKMGGEAREASLVKSWDRVFESVYSAYDVALSGPPAPCPRNASAFDGADQAIEEAV